MHPQRMSVLAPGLSLFGSGTEQSQAPGGGASPFSPPFDSEPLCGWALLVPFPPPQAFSHLLAAVCGLSLVPGAA